MSHVMVYTHVVRQQYKEAQNEYDQSEEDLKSLQSGVGQVSNIPYTYKFFRDVNFAVFAGKLSSMKFKSSNFYKTVVIHLKYKV